MIAVNRSLQADVDALVDVLARERRALVPVASLRAALNWDDDRFADVVAEAEDAGRVQSWEPDGAELVAIITPLEAERRGLALSAGGVAMRWRWHKIGSGRYEKAERDRNRVVHFDTSEGRAVLGGGMLDSETDGIDFMEQIPDRDHEYTPGLKLNGRAILRSKPDREPSKVLGMGVGVWPLEGTKTLARKYREPRAQYSCVEVKDMYVEGDHCPACGRQKSAKTNPNCLVCDLWIDQYKAQVRTLESDPEPEPMKRGPKPKPKPEPQPKIQAPLRHRLWQ